MKHNTIRIETRVSEDLKAAVTAAIENRHISEAELIRRLLVLYASGAIRDDVVPPPAKVTPRLAQTTSAW